MYLNDAGWGWAWAPWALAGVGLVLLFVGGRLVRPALALLGVGLGVMAGWVVGGASPDGVSGLHLAWLAGGLGAVAGGVLGLCLFRPVVALAAALVCGAAAGLGASLWLGAWSPAEMASAAPERASWRPAATLENQARVLLQESMARRGAEHASSTRTHLPDKGGFAGAASNAWEHISARVSDRWERMDASTRMRIVGATSLGALVGLIVGGLGPRRVVAVLSAAVGAGLVVGAAPDVMPVMGIDVSSADPSTWIGLWALLAIIGAAAQLSMLKKPGGRPATSRGAASEGQ